MPLEPAVRDAMLAAMPGLRSSAFSLCRNGDQADDLVQETLLRACISIQSFQPGTNMGAWLYTILRNQFCSERRRRRRLEPLEPHAWSLATKPTQIAHMEYCDVSRALTKLPAKEREALLLIGQSGLSYEEAAQVCGCPTATVKSRVRRARADLAQLAAVEGDTDSRCRVR
jgi:RNA polymerase sigma-70 factor (ECF subfamily)